MATQKTTSIDSDEEINEKLSSLNELIYPYQLAWVAPDEDCEFLERNARYMTKEQLNRLTDNVKNDGFLSQLPFAIKENNKYRILSGNHRVKSAIKAKLPRIMLLYATREMFDEQKQLAIQLSHNAISGQDDMAILQELYSSLTDLTLKAYTGINEQELLNYKALDFSGINEQDIALNEVNFVFSDINRDYTDKVFEALEQKGLDAEKDNLVIGDIDRFIEVMTKCKKRLNIKNRSVALVAMCRICEAYLEACEAEEKTTNPT